MVLKLTGFLYLMINTKITTKAVKYYNSYIVNVTATKVRDTKHTLSERLSK